MKRIPAFALLVMCLFCNAVSAQEKTPANSREELAKKLANPVASLPSLTFRNNLDFAIGPDNGSRWTMNVEPLIPISIGKDWNIINRVIFPVTSQKNTFGKTGRQTGLGDITYSAFFSPGAPAKSGVICGAGPTILIPTSTDELLGIGKFAIGPAVVLLKQAGPFTYGVLANQLWGSGISTAFFQPFLAKAYRSGFSWSLNSENSQDWEGKNFSGSFNLAASQIFKMGTQLYSIGAGPKVWYGNAYTRPEWGMRLIIILLFPK